MSLPGGWTSVICVIAVVSSTLGISPQYASAQDVSESPKAESIEASTQSAPKSENESPTKSEATPNHKDRLGIFVGSLQVKSSRQLEVDKSGIVIGFRTAREWKIGDFLGTAGLGLLHTSIKGNGPAIKGDQTATLTTPLLNVGAGCSVTSDFSLYLGAEALLAKGSDFAPEGQEKGTQVLFTIRASYDLGTIFPAQIVLEHARGPERSERTTSYSTLGLDYLL